VLLNLDEQSPNIAAGVHVNRLDEEVGAGDQVRDKAALFLLKMFLLLVFTFTFALFASLKKVDYYFLLQ
jgi:hypothetical protein